MVDLGRQIVDQQAFFKRELKERVYWFIRLRWLAGGGGLLGGAAVHFLGLALPALPLVLIALFILGYNLVFVWVGKRLDASPTAEARPFQVFVHGQISLDLLALFLLIYFTGGLTSPLMIFTIFHVVLAGILLSPASCFFYACLILLVMGGILIWQPQGYPHSGLPWLEALPFFRDLAFANFLIPYLAFAGGLLIGAYLISSVKVALQTKGRELMRISKELDNSNSKLRSLYEMIKEVQAHSHPKKLMDAATSQAAAIMGVRACSIKLLDESGTCLRFASTYGLSEDYLSKDCISLEKSAVNRQIMEGSLKSIGHIGEESSFQYPEDVIKEGIASMLCLPLKVEQKTLGVFCVYSDETYYFDENDVNFFSLVSDLTALALEKLNRELTKTWFLNKAAHQLRSPLSAIQSMLQVLARGYLGELTEKQQENVVRCEKRLAILQAVINDLLKLASGREEVGPLKLAPVNLENVLSGLEPLYRSQAADKGIHLEWCPQKNLPPGLGQERMLDDLFSNLISNALKYTSAGGRVTVTLASAGPGKILFEVADTGIGIPEADLPHVFSEFFRGSNAKQMHEEGTGLGLIIVREILDRLGGSIRVESKVGQGTRMSCLLPAASA